MTVLHQRFAGMTETHRTVADLVCRWIIDHEEEIAKECSLPTYLAPKIEAALRASAAEMAEIVGNRYRVVIEDDMKRSVTAGIEKCLR